MKKATLYKRKIKALLRGLSRYRSSAQHDENLLKLLISSVLNEDATRKQADKALDAIEREFVDYNELRVTLPRELVERVGKEYPFVRAKAETIKAVLNNIFDRFNRLSIDSLAELPKREARRRLEELGLSPYAAACMAMFGFDYPSVPVDDSLACSLAMNGCVEPDSTRSDVESLVNSVVRQKDAPAAHAFFRRYVEKNAKALAKKRAAEAKARAEAEAKARAEAEAKAKAEAEAKAKAEAEAKARAEARAKRAKQAKRKAAAKKTRKGRKPRKAARPARKPKAARKAAKARRKARPGRKTTRRRHK